MVLIYSDLKKATNWHHTQTTNAATTYWSLTTHDNLREANTNPPKIRLSAHVLWAYGSGRQALVNNRSQHHSLIPTCKELVSLVQLCAFTLTPESPPADSEASSQSQLYSIGSSCCFAFYFLQPHYDRTGSHSIYHLLWLLKGVCVGGRDLYKLQTQLTCSEPELNNLWRTNPFSKQKYKHLLISSF